MGFDYHSAVEKCKAIGQLNRLNTEAVGIFIANHHMQGVFGAYNPRTGKTEPIRNERRLERLLVTFCHAYEHQQD